MRRAILLLLAALLAAAVPRSATAQRVRKNAPAPGRCRVDSSADWFRRQRRWDDETRHDWSDDALRGALLRAAGSEATNPGTLLGVEVVGDASGAPAGGGAAGGDAELRARMLDSLRALARNRQAPWPTRSVVGPAGVRAVWLLVAGDTALARTALHRMMEAGPEESPPAAVATLEDRLRLKAGRKQIYGTQLLRAADGALEPAPLEDPEHLDLRRDAAGLPPLSQAVCATRAPPSR